MPCHYHILVVGLFLFVTQSAREVFSQSSPHEIRGETMGTTYDIKWVDEITNLGEIKQRVDARLHAINALMSTYDKESELSKFNLFRQTDWFPVSAETAKVVQAALEMSEISKGAFDPTVGKLVRMWNFGPDPDKSKTPAEAEIQTALKTVGYHLVKVQQEPPALSKSKPEVELDLSAIAKGYAVDEVVALLAADGIFNCMVEIGGEVRVAGTKENNKLWTLGIERPEIHSNSISAKVELNNQALATSGNYRNFFEKDGVLYSHTIDPRTGKPVLHQLASASVLAEDCMTADAWATTMMVLGPNQGLKLADAHNLSAYLLVRQGESFRELASKAVAGQFINLTQVVAEPEPAMSPFLSTFLLSITIFLIAIGGLAAGVILSNKTLKGSCGGVEGLKDKQGRSICDMCTTPPEECDQMKEKLREQLQNSDSSVT